MSYYGWYITQAGWELMTKLAAGETTLTLTRIMVGSGQIADTGNPQAMTDLISPMAQATSTMPQASGTTISLTVEYRNDLNGGLSEGFYINEMGIFADDPDEGEILMYYGTLGQYPQWIDAYDNGIVETRRYLISMAFDTETGVTIAYPLSAWLTAADIYEYCTVTILPEFLEDVQELIDQHNADSTAHPALQSLIYQETLAREAFQTSLIKSVSGSSYTELFETLDAVTVTGTWNESCARIEF